MQQGQTTRARRQRYVPVSLSLPTHAFKCFPAVSLSPSCRTLTFFALYFYSQKVARQAQHVDTALLLERGISIGLEQALRDACEKGDDWTLKNLLAQGVFTEASDVHGSRPLHLAARGGHVAVVTLLLAQKVDANAREQSGETPLMLAACSGHVEVVRLLLAYTSINADACNNSGETALHLASRSGQGVCARASGFRCGCYAEEQLRRDSIGACVKTRAVACVSKCVKTDFFLAAFSRMFAHILRDCRMWHVRRVGVTLPP